jgi:hypothetical protein
MPTLRGDISVAIENGRSFDMKIETPAGSKTRVILPRTGEVTVDGKSIGNQREIENLAAGSHTIEVK